MDSAEIDRLSARVAELERENILLEAFAAQAAHELMEPLVMTEAFAAMVAERLRPDQLEAREDLDTVARGAARTRRLVESLLLEAGSREHAPRRERVDLAVTVRESVAMLAPEIASRGAEIDIGELPVVTGEAALLGSVFNNLIVNALKYSPRQESVVRIGAEREPGLWRLWVESGGPTLAPADRARIFDPFSRAAGERRARGSGLGLAICRRVVERHGGTIGVVPAAGGGNRFAFTLPAEPDA